MMFQIKTETDDKLREIRNYVKQNYNLRLNDDGLISVICTAFWRQEELNRRKNVKCQEEGAQGKLDGFS